MSDAPEPAKPRRPELTLRELRFAEHYVEHGSASEAYRSAGFPPVTAASARVLGWRLLRKEAVREIIRQMRQEALDAARVSVQRIVQATARIAFADRADLFDDRGRLLPPKDWPADIRGAVEVVESEDLFEPVERVDPESGKVVKRKELVGYTRKVRTGKRIEALKLLAQWKQMIGPDAADTTKPPPA
ncbi:MAG: terminase small subunit, partial [Gemmataceae bacterium]|nr:terminase small subunit [Gemmataceae bacterium]